MTWATLHVPSCLAIYRSLPCHPAYSLYPRALIRSRVASLSDNSSNNFPSCDGDVVLWAQDQFQLEVLNGVNGSPRREINVVKASMFIALEEAAAASPKQPSSDSKDDIALKFPPLPLQNKTLSNDKDENINGGNGTSSDQNIINLLAGVGAASTWNLERINALSMDAAAEFYRLCSEAGAVGVQAVVKAGADDSALLTVFSDLVVTFPMNLISAINTTLFERQGYRRMRKHGDPRDASLGAVLESGQGGPGALAVLYMALAERCELSLHACPLDDGRYFVLWPVDQRVVLGAGGERFVIDPYAQGSLLSEREIAEMFGEEIPLQPASPAEILAAGLAPLRDAHWSKALGCPPEPAFMVPISLDLALGQYTDTEVSVSYDNEWDLEEESRNTNSNNREGNHEQQHWWPQRGYSLQRALAAAQKRRWLLPDNVEAAMHLGVLLFFSGEYAQACSELSVAVEMAEMEENTAEAEKLKVLWHKARLMAEFGKAQDQAA